MIQKLRKRFIMTVMYCFLPVLLLILTAVNCVYRYNVYSDIDRRLVYLADSFIGPPQGMIDSTPGHMRQWLDMNDAGIMSPYSYFIFSGYMTLDVRMQSVELLSYALGEDANPVLQGILGGAKDFGNVGQYRYYAAQRADPYNLVLLRCENEFEAMRSLLHSSILVGLGCFLLVLLLVTAFSGRAIRPFAENIENQKRFISNAGHELKTPLGVIVSDLDMQVLEGGETEWIANAQVQADHLALLIEQLMTYTLLDEKNNRPAPAPVDLSALGELLLSDYRPLTLSKALTLTADIEPNVTAMGNENALRTLLSVLLDNAVKYTPEGGRVCLRIRREKKAVVTVENTCEGLEGVRLDQLFERFYRAPLHRATQEGSGLGLSIAHDIAALYGGSIRAEAPAPGSVVFTAEL